ncbi:MAG: hypothetical protein M1315_02265 [Candidatus Thermoplasmatota archaeon]|nr:hypothetical protein [Candidatus Thermoplasmatota archaeon]
MKVIDLYLRRWDIEVFHRELKQYGPRYLYQRTHESLLGTANLSLLEKLTLEISAIRSLEFHIKMGKCKSGMRFRSMAMRVLVDLFMAIEKGGKKFLGALMGSFGGKIAKV